MKRKLTAVCLAVLLVLTLVPVMAGAEPVTHALTVSVTGEGELGIKIGGGETQLVDTAGKIFEDIDEDTQIVVTWEPGEDAFLKDLIVGGGTVPAGEGEYETSYTFTMSEATAVAATFEKYEMVSFDVSIEGPGYLHMLENGNWEGVAEGAGSISVPVGSTLKFKASTEDGNDFRSAYVNGLPVEATPEEAGSYTFEIPDVQQDGTLKVVFAEMADIDVEIEGPGYLHMLENGRWEGVAEGADSISVPVGSTLTFRATPGEGASFLIAVVNGQPVNVTEKEGSYEFEAPNLQKNSKIEVAFLGPIDIGVYNKDEATGIEYYLPSELVAPGSNITPDSKLDISAVTGGDAYATAKAAVANFGSVFKVYDITLMNSGGAYQPNVPVFLRFPLPDGYSTNPANLHVVHIKSDGSAEELEFELSQGEDGKYYLEVQVTSFSMFAIVDASQTAAGNGSKAPKTGDAENAMLFLILAAASAGLIGCTAFRKAKKNRAR